MTEPGLTSRHANVDPDEIARFEALADRWWDPTGEFGALHAINPLRVGYIAGRAKLAGATVLDVGCGGGILAEALAQAGATVTGIDLADAALTAARAHAAGQHLTIDYQRVAAEDFAATNAGRFDIVTCLEMLEHVPHPAAIVSACRKLVKTGGNVFFSTINRNPKSWLVAIVGAEYALKLVPKGTHDYAKFIRPSELDGWARDCGLELCGMTGLHYNPLTTTFRLAPGVDVNYFAHYRVPAAGSGA